MNYVYMMLLTLMPKPDDIVLTQEVLNIKNYIDVLMYDIWCNHYVYTKVRIVKKNIHKLLYGYSVCTLCIKNIGLTVY